MYKLKTKYLIYIQNQICHDVVTAVQLDDEGAHQYEMVIDCRAPS